MKEKEHPIIEITTRPGNIYDDDNIPEIDLPKPSNVTTNVTPDEVPRRDGPGGEESNWGRSKMNLLRPQLS